MMNGYSLAKVQFFIDLYLFVNFPVEVGNYGITHIIIKTIFTIYVRFLPIPHQSLLIIQI